MSDDVYKIVDGDDDRRKKKKKKYAKYIYFGAGGGGGDDDDKLYFFDVEDDEKKYKEEFYQNEYSEIEVAMYPPPPPPKGFKIPDALVITARELFRAYSIAYSTVKLNKIFSLLEIIRIAELLEKDYVEKRNNILLARVKHLKLLASTSNPHERQLRIYYKDIIESYKQDATTALQSGSYNMLLYNFYYLIGDCIALEILYDKNKVSWDRIKMMMNYIRSKDIPKNFKMNLNNLLKKQGSARKKAAEKMNIDLIEYFKTK